MSPTPLYVKFLEKSLQNTPPSLSPCANPYQFPNANSPRYHTRAIGLKKPPSTFPHSLRVRQLALFFFFDFTQNILVFLEQPRIEMRSIFA